MVALFILGWGHARFWLRDWSGLARSVLFGVTMGLGAVATIVMAAEVEPGRLIDLRACLLAVAAFFGGPIAAVISVVLAAGWRLLLGGGSAGLGVALILVVSAAGLTLRGLVGRRPVQEWHALALGLVVGAANIGAAIFADPISDLSRTIPAYLGPMILLNLVGIMLASVVFLSARRLSAERDLLTAALAQAPDYTYVKDRYSRFVVVNTAVAELHGFARPEDMVGKTDFDIAPAERAQVLFDQEQRALATGTPIVDLEELLPTTDGVARWFTTSKVPLHNKDGMVIGLAGATRDVTVDKRLQQEVLDSRDTLRHALAGMSDGLAVYGSDGRLIFANDQYRACFPRTGHVRQVGAHLRDILRAVVQTDEQSTVPRHDVEGWIELIVDNLNRESEEEVNLFDGSWLQVRTRPTSNGSTMVVTTDITRIKQAELALHSATDQLKEMARTDALTDLLNRRAFDEILDTEIGRTSRSQVPLSLLLVDVDHFKAFNDTYGHPAGDECLKLVGHHLRASLKRAADVAARYGGEEFVAILPETDEDGAYLVAEGFRKALAGALLPHSGSEKGFLTASVGVATYGTDNVSRSAAELIETADRALYGAKAAGRDRVLGKRINPREQRYAQN